MTLPITAGIYAIESAFVSCPAARIIRLYEQNAKAGASARLSHGFTSKHNISM